MAAYEDEHIIASMPHNVYWLNRDCVLLGGNDNLARMLGLSSHTDLVGLTYEEMTKLAKWTQEQSDLFKRAELEVMETGIPRFNVEEPPLIINGKTRFYISSKSPLYNHKRDIIGIVSVSTDITDRKQVETALKVAKEKAEANNKAKTEFLENMRHDIRTPLVGITGFANLISDEVNDPRIKEYADNLTASSNALLDLMNEILEVIKVNSGEVPLLKKKFNLKKRLDDVITLNQAKAFQKQIELIFEHDERIPEYVIGDPTRIHRVVLELIANALNFTHTGFVKLRTRLSESTKRDLVIKIIVEDTGIGIEPDKHEEIFLQFKRLSPSYKGIYKGTGLGLAIARRFLDEMDSEIYVDSKVGQGATFTCIIPLKKPLLSDAFGSDDTIHRAASKLSSSHTRSSSESPGSREPSDPSHRNKILLVEDQLIATIVVKNLMAHFNCDVDVAPDGKTAVQLAKDHTYDLIFMDIGLPDIDGYEVTQRIRLNELNKGTHVPIIALTAHVDEDNKQQCLEVGMNAILTKPLLRDKAEDILNAFIAYRKQPGTALRSEPEPSKVVDFDKAKRQLGKTDVVLQLLNMLVDSFPEEVRKLEDARQEKNWEIIKNIAHKLKGGSSYCGTTRLHNACDKLEQAIRSNQMEMAETLYEAFINEMIEVQKAVKKGDY